MRLDTTDTSGTSRSVGDEFVPRASPLLDTPTSGSQFCRVALLTGHSFHEELAMRFRSASSLIRVSRLLLLSAVAIAEDKRPPNRSRLQFQLRPPPPKLPTDLSGHWSGTWLSHSNGHDGPITGDFRKIDDDHYCVHFDGDSGGLFPFEYDVVLTVTERKDDKLTMSGSSNLGFLFARFRTTRTVTDTCFTASYCSKHDHGVFNMTRCTRCQ